MNAAYGPEVGQQIINWLEEGKLGFLFTFYCHRHLFAAVAYEMYRRLEEK
jgi:hypothetical protein